MPAEPSVAEAVAGPTASRRAGRPGAARGGPADRAPEPPPPAPKPPEVVPIGQHRESYILATGPDGLLILDQHAAHERILYERIRDRIASGRMLSQRLLLRALFEATPEEVETIAARFEDLKAAGFEIEPMSGRSYAIAVPSGRGDGPRAGRDAPRRAARLWPEGGSATPEERRDRLAASLACRSAVTIRYHLASEEIRRLLSDWGKAADRFTCPHGRPVVLSMTRGRAREILQEEVADS